MDALILGAVGLGGLYAISQDKKKKYEQQQAVASVVEGMSNLNTNSEQDLNACVRKGVYDYPSDASATKSYMDQQKFEEVLRIQNDYNKQLTQSTNISNALTGDTSHEGFTTMGAAAGEAGAGGAGAGGAGANADHTLLTGEKFSKDDFNHNNMVPFFGSKVRGRGPNANQAEILLDNMAGTGTLQINNTEQAPLFRPEENIQQPHGMQVHTDFLQSRVNPGMANNNNKPWEEIRVGPGLGQGFTAAGSGGFNAGMEARNDWLPKTVNELRVETNPKVSYGLANHEGPAIAKVTNVGILGDVNKYQPDTYYINSPERYFTTTGQEKAPTGRAFQALKDQSRPETTTQYGGIAGRGDKQAPKAPENYQPALRDHVFGEQLGLPHNHTGQTASDGDYGRLGFKVLSNNRSTTDTSTNYGTISGIIGAVVAPVLDAIRPTRKSNAIGNIRTSGNVQKSGGGGEYVYNYGIENQPKVTLKQMAVENSPFYTQVQHQNLKPGGYNSAEYQAVDTNRLVTTTPYAGGADSGGNEGVFINDMYYRQRNNINKETAEAQVHGNMNLLNGDVNVRLNANKTFPNERDLAPSNGPYGHGPSAAQHGALSDLPQSSSYNQDAIGTDRINPSVLDAFKQNPYTQSLMSY
jgi:hypothetical protein